MSKPTIVIAGVEREMTDEEYTQHLKDQQEFAERTALINEVRSAKQALLDKLGITKEEAILLTSQL